MQRTSKCFINVYQATSMTLSISSIWCTADVKIRFHSSQLFFCLACFAEEKMKQGTQTIPEHSSRMISTFCKDAVESSRFPIPSRISSLTTCSSGPQIFIETIETTFYPATAQFSTFSFHLIAPQPVIPATVTSMQNIFFKNITLYFF